VQLPLWLEKNWDEWTASGGGGYAYNSSPGAKNFGFVGGKIRRDLTEKLNLGLELFYQSADNIESKDVTMLIAGGSYQINNAIGVEFSLGHNVTGQNQTIAYLGFAFE
jgi:hypothetical protein